ncbi:MAG: energy transducer TonB [Bacteroidetes bacterium HGW-Bacteroidetes-2]|jgi:protein TonB|nr:MAG: energy transducer TonB [Bacteroidetes bacterium HGW-Bacteroidetes-2]
MKKIIVLLVLLTSFSGFTQEWGDVQKNKVTLKEIAPIWPGCEGSDVAKRDACFDQKLNEHVRKNFRYPANAWKENVQERVVVKFLVNTKGEIEILTVEGKNQELKDEAKRNILSIPKMKPGMFGGKPKAIEYAVPFNFKTGK